MQFHTGFGDPDLDLRLANPLHLRPLFESEALRGLRIVCLHCYPYVREAGYLASVLATARWLPVRLAALTAATAILGGRALDAGALAGTGSVLMLGVAFWSWRRPRRCHS